MRSGLGIFPCINYNNIDMKLIETLTRNSNIIINTDIDGILSGLILTNIIGCKVVGFSNSADKVWLNHNLITNPKDGVYIDMYVSHPDVITIDQHIIAANESHANILMKNPNKFNPNLEQIRCFQPSSLYYIKYPFGTIHYLIAKLESEEIVLNLDLNNKLDEFRMGDVILRADDTMTTTLNSRYTENAESWWEWLLSISNSGVVTTKLKNYLDACPTTQEFVVRKKESIAKWFNEKYHCSTPDGGYNDVMDENGHLLDCVCSYITDMACLANLECFCLSDVYTLHKGCIKRESFTSADNDKLINSNSFRDKSIFSYAFVRTSNKDNNFSYTYDMD